MNSLRPALVTQRAARRLPRSAMLGLCAVYLLPGLVGRDPWRSADIAAFGQMLAIAEGRTPWWAPMLGGVPADAALLPHWVGAAFIAAGSGWVDPSLAARIPFTLLLALALGFTWYTAYHLARTEAALPLPFAFGGEADPIDYARAIADGAVLALMATLGLLQLGHETTPELGQLCAMSMYGYALAAAPYRPRLSRLAVLAGLPMLAGSGAPSMALAAGTAGLAVCALSRLAVVRTFTLWVALSMAAAAATATVLAAWRWRIPIPTVADLSPIARQWLWFLWPSWPLGLWTLWRWRRQLAHRHIAIPLACASLSLGASLAMGGSDRALMLSLPGLAVLAAFALPTLKRSAAAAVDWFSVCLFSLAAVFVWTLYSAMQTGFPAKPAANIARVFPGFETSFSPAALVFALAGTVAWVGLVRWRTSGHREALWKSLVLPAGGVALCWLLVMTLWLPLADYARSPRPLVSRIRALIPARTCVAAPELSAANVAALEYFGPWVVDAGTGAEGRGCNYLVRTTRERPLPPSPPGWQPLGEISRPGYREEITQVFRRQGQPEAAEAARGSSVPPVTP